MGSGGDGVAGGGRGPGHTWPKSHRWGWRRTGDSSLDSCKKSWWGRWGMGTSRWEGVWGTHDLGSMLRAQPRGGVVGGWPAAQRRLKFPFKSRAQVSPQDPPPQALTPWGCVSRALLLLWNLPCFPGLLAFPPQGEYGIEDPLIPRKEKATLYQGPSGLLTSGRKAHLPGSLWLTRWHESEAVEAITTGRAQDAESRWAQGRLPRTEPPPLFTASHAPPASVGTTQLLAFLQPSNQPTRRTHFLRKCWEGLALPRGGERGVGGQSLRGKEGDIAAQLRSVF